MDRRNLLLWISFAVCVSGFSKPANIQAQQSPTPALTAQERPQNRSFGRVPSGLAVSAQELSDGISIANVVPQRFAAAVQGETRDVASVAALRAEVKKRVEHLEDFLMTTKEPYFAGTFSYGGRGGHGNFPI